MSEGPVYIVAEVSRNWPAAGERNDPLLSQRFEAILNVNRLRGYVLQDWKLSRTTTQGDDGKSGLNETIIAVFIRADCFNECGGVRR